MSAPLKYPAPRVYQWVDFTPVIDTAAYAQGDVLFISQICSNAAWKVDQIMKLEQVMIIDEDDETAIDLTLIFLDANVSVGALNAAFAPSDTVARSITGKFAIVAADWLDAGGVKIAMKSPGVFVKPVSGTRDIYIAGYIPGAMTPTYTTAADIKMRLCFSS